MLARYGASGFNLTYRLMVPSLQMGSARSSWWWALQRFCNVWLWHACWQTSVSQNSPWFKGFPLMKCGRTGACDLQNSNTLVTTQELLDESTNHDSASISSRVLERITEWASSGKLPPFTVHQVRTCRSLCASCDQADSHSQQWSKTVWVLQAASVALRLQEARHCFAAALEASMLPAGPEQIAKTATYKQCIKDMLNR